MQLQGGGLLTARVNTKHLYEDYVQ